MQTIYHDLIINVSREKVFEAVSTPQGLNNWWTLHCKGKPGLNEKYNLYFGEGYDWFASLSKFNENEAIEFSMTDAMEEWLPTSFGFILKQENGDRTYVQFYHTNWYEVSQEFRIASYCWANLLRELKQYLEKGIITPFEDRN
ncbi:MULTISPECIES: SRPBCC family protein [Flavobacterium]|uniref:SRPBCC family protein n=1 Tax=Flavobacterium TaxID=237 RepID=UPI001FCA9F42|nr:MULTISPECIES: SRPBCC domain-containing protein [Flavobacterium]UOK42017.1 SRPBCC domain-containing protein [Flavobacterium enshiense]